MKKKIKKNTQIPAHTFGMFAQISQAVEGIGDGLTQSGNIGAGAILSGAANPVKAGLQYMGNKDVSVGNKLLAFTGVGSIFAAKQAEKARKRRENQAKDTAYGLNNTAMMAQNYWQDNELASTYAMGGMIPQNMAYLDNGEVVRDDSGNIDQVPDTTNGTDEHLVDASQLESVLSNKLKRPGTNKTFAQEGEKLTKMKRTSKGKDIFAENTNKLNEYNANLAYNNLLMEQERLKLKKGIKPKTKGIAPAYADGKKAPAVNYNPDLYGSDRPISPGMIPQLDAQRLGMPSITPYTSAQAQAISKAKTAVAPNAKTSGNGFNLNNISNTISGLSPVISNLFGRQPEQEQQIINPYTGAINAAMAKRRMDIEPIRQANSRTRAIGNYNAANMNTNTGANMALRTQSAVDEYANNANLESTRQNANNAYLGEYANVLNNLGQQYTQNAVYTSDINAKNRAAARNYTQQGLSQLGQWSQIQQQMANQKNKDDMMYPLLSDFLSQGFTKEQIASLNKRFGKR